MHTGWFGLKQYCSLGICDGHINDDKVDHKRQRHITLDNDDDQLTRARIIWMIIMIFDWSVSNLPSTIYQPPTGFTSTFTFAAQCSGKGPHPFLDNKIMTRVSLSPTCAQYKRCGRGRSNDTSGTERPSPDPASTSKCQDVKKSMFALFHLDAVLVIPFAGEGEE